MSRNQKGYIGLVVIMGGLALYVGAIYLEYRGYCISPHTCTAGYPK